MFCRVTLKRLHTMFANLLIHTVGHLASIDTIQPSSAPTCEEPNWLLANWFYAVLSRYKSLGTKRSPAVCYIWMSVLSYDFGSCLGRALQADDLSFLCCYLHTSCSVDICYPGAFRSSLYQLQSTFESGFKTRSRGALVILLSVANFKFHCSVCFLNSGNHFDASLEDRSSGSRTVHAYCEVDVPVI